MVFHVVLFKPRQGLTNAERAGVVEAFENAVRRIPSVRRFSVGRRVRHGAGYEAGMTVDLDYGAVLEFDDLAGLRAYLEHPAHRALGRRFMESLESSAIYDYAMQSADELRALAQPE